MKNISSFRIFLYAIFASLTIFALIKTDNSPNKITNSFIARLLATNTKEEMLHEMCQKSSSDLETFYSETNPSYTFNPEGGNNFINDLLMNFLNKTRKIEIGKDEIISYSKDNIFYIILLVLFILLVLCWIPYIVCVFTKKCCCVSQSCSGNLKILLFVCILFSGGVIASCIIGYTKNTNVLNGIYGLGCSILKLENHLVQGDEYKKETPYWIGLSPIVNKLVSTKDEIQAVGDNSTKVSTALDGTNKLFNIFSTDIENEWNAKKNIEISSPIPNDEDKKITPDYIQKYGSMDDSSTRLGAIKAELDKFNELTIPQLTKIIEVVDINEKTKDIKNNINSIAHDLNNTISKIEEKISSGIGTYYDKFNEIDSLVRRIMNILFTLNLAIAVAFVVSIILLLFCKCGSILTGIFWFFIYIFMMASLLLGCVLGLAGSFVKDASFAVKNIMNNINNINYDKFNYLDICINGNGSLAHTNIIPIDFDTSIVDNIYNLESNISIWIGKIGSYNYLSIKANEELYNQVNNNLANYVMELKRALGEIKLYINSEVDGSKVSTEIKDTWVVNKENCNNDYLPNNSLRNLLLEDIKPCCLVITEWSESDIQARYSSLVPKDSSDNILEIILKYFNSINNFMEENTKLMEEIINKNKDFSNSFNEIKNSEINILNDITNIIQPLRNIYEGTIANGSIFEIMNCKFIKRDTNKVVEILYNKCGGTFKDTSLIFLIISVCEILLTIFVLTVMKSIKGTMTEIPNYSKYSQLNNK